MLDYEEILHRISEVSCIMMGRIFNIQKYSIHDGPGIRTTVFFKGCPLSCWWCHNPESQSSKEELVYDPNKCISCGDCEKTCPTEALEQIGSKITTEDLIKEIEKDMVFYEQSGGGVTFSGGEPLLQIDFLDELLTYFKKRGIHTTLDTCGYSSWANLLRIKDKVDLFLYDIKHMDDEKHMEYVGVSNKQILSNLEDLAMEGSDIWIRIPIIPGINDDRLNLQNICDYLLKLNLKRVFLLPYHDIGIDKYKKLNMDYKMIDNIKLDDNKVSEIAEMFKEHGFNARIGG